MSPAFPRVAAPVCTSMAPEAPALEVPVFKVIAPLVPALPELSVASDNRPLDVARLNPVAMFIIPPVPPIALPPRKSIVPPTSLTPPPLPSPPVTCT